MKLAAVGSNCIDFYENLEGGKACPGGGPVNMAVYTLRLGGEASYIGPVGRDAYGLFLKDSLKSKGVDVSHMEEMEGETAVSKVYLISGERIFGDYNEGVLSSYQLSNADLDFISEHDMVVCDLWGKVGYQFREIKGRGVRTAFDCAERPDDAACKDAIPYTDYLFFSDDEHGDDYLKEKMKELKEKGPELVICMRGIKGSLCFDDLPPHTRDFSRE